MKPKKNTRQRGGKTHGWGSKKKHRGAGNRGGRGNAGSGKRGDQKKPAYWNSAKTMKSSQKRGQNYFGKYGFGMYKRSNVSVITARELDAKLPVWAAEKKATHASGAYTVDLTSLGYDKLLGTGRISAKVKITVASATAKAVEKVSAAGGSVQLAEAPAEEAAEDAE